MHSLFAGLMGLFVGLGSFFHGGQGVPAHIQQTSTVQQASSSGAPAATGSGHRMFGRGRKLPNGEKPFFGTVTAVNGSALTVQMQWPMRPNQQAATPKTLTVTLTSTTTYTGGTQASITTNTKIAGVGTTNSDGSITATQVRINPTFPTGFPHRGEKPQS